MCVWDRTGVQNGLSFNASESLSRRSQFRSFTECRKKTVWGDRTMDGMYQNVTRMETDFKRCEAIDTSGPCNPPPENSMDCGKLWTCLVICWRRDFEILSDSYFTFTQYSDNTNDLSIETNMMTFHTADTSSFWRIVTKYWPIIRVFL